MVPDSLNVVPDSLGGSSDVIFRQLFDAEHGSSTYTYLLADPNTKEAVLIDPVVELVSFPRILKLESRPSLHSRSLSLIHI